MNERALRARPQADHEHVSRISTGTILFIITAAAITLYELQLVLIPFVLAGVISYICAPAVTFVGARTGLPRVPVAIFFFLIFHISLNHIFIYAHCINKITSCPKMIPPIRLFAKTRITFEHQYR